MLDFTRRFEVTFKLSKRDFAVEISNSSISLSFN